MFYGAGAGVQGIYGLWPPEPMKVIADTTTAIPGGSGPFMSFTQTGRPTDPCISGTNVVFWAAGSGGQQGIYALLEGVLTTIADTNTPIPGGTGNFVDYPPCPWISGESVVSVGFGSGGQQGIYVVWPPNPWYPPQPIYPPEPLKVLDLNDQLDGKTISSLRLGRGGLDGGLLAFSASFTDGTQGLYTIAVPMPLRIISLYPPDPIRSQDLNISFTTLPAHNYVLQGRSDVVAGGWTTLPGTYLGTGGIVQTTVTNALSQPQQFFRVQQSQ